MTNTFAKIIADYRERYATKLQEAEPGSVEQYAFSHMMQAFDRDAEDSLPISIPATWAGFSRVLSHPQARAIVREWTLDFIRDTGQSPNSYFH